MAEALGIAASIIAVLTISGTVTSLSYKYLSTSISRDVRHQITDLREELHALENFLLDVQEVIGQQQSSSSNAWDVSSLEPWLGECRSELETLEAKLTEPVTKRQRLKTAMTKILWPLKSSDTAR